MSNATRWDTFEGMMRGAEMPKSERLFRKRYQKSPSFLSIHMGVRADLLSEVRASRPHSVNTAAQQNEICLHQPGMHADCCITQRPLPPEKAGKSSASPQHALPGRTIGMSAAWEPPLLAAADCDVSFEEALRSVPPLQTDEEIEFWCGAGHGVPPDHR